MTGPSPGPPRHAGAMLSELEAVRRSAVHRAIDPISLEDLRAKSDEVGALVYAGQRVEPALYHQSSVLDEDGELLLKNGLSPFMQENVNGFLLAPPLSSLRQLIHFLDWNNDGWLSVSEVAMGLAALLPVDEDAAEHFIRDHLDVDQDGLIGDEALQQQMEPYCGERLSELLLAAPVTQVPPLLRGSSREELLRWFGHWDAHGSGSLDLPDIRFAIAWTFFRALGSSADLATKETASALFLAEAGIHGSGQVSCEHFLELFAPALQANMPAADSASGEGAKRKLLRQSSNSSILSNGQIAVVIHAPVDGRILEAELQSCEAVEASLLSQMEEKWGETRWRLFLAGQPLQTLSREDLKRQLLAGTCVQVLPSEAGGAVCSFM